MIPRGHAAHYPFFAAHPRGIIGSVARQRDLCRLVLVTFDDAPESDEHATQRPPHAPDDTLAPRATIVKPDAQSVAHDLLAHLILPLADGSQPISIHVLTSLHPQRE